MAIQENAELDKIKTVDIVQEIKRRAASTVLRKLNSTMTPHDALVFTLGAIIGIGLDIFFFAGGLSSPTVSLLFGSGVMVCWKLLKNTLWYKKRTLKAIKEFQDKSLITEDEAYRWRQVIIEQYISIDDIKREE